MWRQVVAQSPGENAPAADILRYDVGWKALNTMLKSGRSLSGHERNCCFLNTQGKRFADISAAAGLDFDDDGRVVALSDWDFDGDVDFWIANRTGPQVRFMRNDSANQHSYVAFRLEGVQCNRDAIGAQVEVYLTGEDGAKRCKTLRAGAGYLAQSSKWLHFGLGDETEIARVVVKWPDGLEETLQDVAVNQRYRVRQGDGTAEIWTAPDRELKLTPSTIKAPEASDESRIVLISPIPLPNIKYEHLTSGVEQQLEHSGRPKLINLWATWCQPCIQELGEWKANAEQLGKGNIDVIAINVDEPNDDRDEQKKQIRSMFAAMQLPFDGGIGTASLVNQFDVVQRSILRRQQPMPVPCSFLVDGRGNLRVLYKGRVEASQLSADVKLLGASGEEIVAASTPYEGVWLGQPVGTAPNILAIRFLEGGFVAEAEAYLRQLMLSDVENPAFNPAEALVLLGAICADQRRLEEAADAFRAALQIAPDHRQSHIELAEVLAKLGQAKEAAEHYRHALERRQNDPELRLKLALQLMATGEVEQAVDELNESLSLRPTDVAHHHLGNALISLGRSAEAVESFEAAIRLNPSFSAPANNLAWILSTKTEIRNAERAVELASAMLASAGARTAGNLDTMAAAYASAGQFDQAVRTAEEAVRLATAKGNTEQADRIGKRLQLYRNSKPYRE